MFDARGKLRAAMVTNGYLPDDSREEHMNGWPELDEFLRTDRVMWDVPRRWR